MGERGLCLPDLELVVHCKFDAGLVKTIGHIGFVLNRIEQLSGCHTIDQVNGGAFLLGHGVPECPTLTKCYTQPLNLNGQAFMKLSNSPKWALWASCQAQLHPCISWQHCCGPSAPAQEESCSKLPFVYQSPC